MVDERSASEKVLAWLRPEERQVCAVCSERTRIDLTALGSWICLGCGASSVGGGPVSNR